jgi:hypothetical protein
MSNEQESELERQMFKLEELDLTKLKQAVAELERIKGEFRQNAHDFLDTEIEVFGELIEKVERAD